MLINNDLKNKNHEKYKSIQMIRGVAICIIVLSHINPSEKIEFDLLGTVGVSLFIAISGIMDGLKDNTITCGMTQFDNEKLFDIFLKRIKKLYPLHILTFLFSIPLVVFHREFSNIGSAIIVGIINLFCLQSWVPLKSVYFSYNSVSWYLTLVFYITFVHWMLKKFNGIKLQRKVYSLLILVLILVWNAIFIFFKPENLHWYIYIFPGCRVLEYLLAYSFVAWFKDTSKQTLKSSLLFSSVLLICLTFLCFFVVDNPWFYAVVWVIPSIVFVSSCALLEKKIIKEIGNNLFLVIGDYSLAIFLLHQLIIKYTFSFLHLLGMRREPFKSIFCLLNIMIVITIYYITQRFIFPRLKTSNKRKIFQGEKK